MSKIPAVKPKKILQIIKKHGFYIHHQRGSHIVLKNNAYPSRRVTVSFHQKDLKRKTLMSILEQAGLDKSALTSKN